MLKRQSFQKNQFYKMVISKFFENFKIKNDSPYFLQKHEIQ